MVNNNKVINNNKGINNKNKGGIKMVNKNKMVSEILEIIKIPTTSEKTYIMQEYIENRLKQMNVKYNKDNVGNIYYLKKNQPLLSAHMDTVGGLEDLAMLKYVTYKNGQIYGFGNIGADDKCGIFIILKLLEKYGNKLNFIFSVDEEIGGIGINHIDKTQGTVLDMCLYGIVLDRRNSGDIIGYNNNYCTENFEDTIYTTISEFGYKPAIGSFSDADTLKDHMSVINLSVGYYQPHTQNEFIIVKELINALNATDKIISTIRERFEKPKPFIYTNRYNRKYNNRYNEYLGLEYGEIDEEYINKHMSKDNTKYKDTPINELVKHAIDNIKAWFIEDLEIVEFDDGLLGIEDELIYDAISNTFLDEDGEEITLYTAACILVDYFETLGEDIKAVKIKEKWGIL